MRKVNSYELMQLCARAGVIDQSALFKSTLRRQLPIHHAVEFVSEFDVLINYPVKNPQKIKTLVITSEEVFFSTATTKSLLHYRMRHAVFDVSMVRCLKETIGLPVNCELSLCFGNWVAMHLSGVSSSKCSDWVALHRVVRITKNQERCRLFIFRDQLRLTLTVQEDFNRRFEKVCLMSTIELEALHCLYHEAGVDDHELLICANILRQNDYRFARACELVRAHQVGEFLELFDLVAIRQICHHPEYEVISSTFEDSEYYFVSRLRRKRSFS